MDDGETMESFDVSSLFNNVPIGEAIDIIKAKLEEDESLGERTPLLPGRVAEFLQLHLKSTYFSFNGEFFEQREGAGTSASITPPTSRKDWRSAFTITLEASWRRRRLYK